MKTYNRQEENEYVLYNSDYVSSFYYYLEKSILF